MSADDLERVVEAKLQLERVDPGEYPPRIAGLVDSMQNGLEDLETELRSLEDG